MTKQAWNWLNTIVFTIAGGALGHSGYLLLQDKDMEWGEWWLTVGWVLVVVMQTMNLWDDSRRRRNAAGAPGRAIRQGPKVADSD